MEYPKINTLWKRDDGHNIIEGDYACPEFASHKKWRVQEKIDGMNIRIYISQDGKVEVKGRTDQASIPPYLLNFISMLDIARNLSNSGLFTWVKTPIIMFGEGFGGKIQSGGRYSPTESFILFDVYVNGRWSTREEVDNFAIRLNLLSPHDFGMLTVNEIIEFVKSKPIGRYNRMSYEMEGVIARSEPLVRFNTMNANPVMFKLKARDFKD